MHACAHTCCAPPFSLIEVHTRSFLIIILLLKKFDLSCARAALRCVADGQVPEPDYTRFASVLMSVLMGRLLPQVRTHMHQGACTCTKAHAQARKHMRMHARQVHETHACACTRTHARTLLTHFCPPSFVSLPLPCLPWPCLLLARTRARTHLALCAVCVCCVCRTRSRPRA